MCLTVVFFGDSITDCGCNGDYLGDGYVSIINKGFKDKYLIINKGISGDKTKDLVERLEEIDFIKPDIVVLMIGINDIWHKFEYGFDISNLEFEKNYGKLVTSINQIGSKLILVHPYVIDSEQMSDRFKGYLSDFKEDLKSKIDIINKFAGYAHGIVKLYDIFLKIQQDTKGDNLSIDGIHPTAEGHNIIAYHISKLL